MNRRPRARYRVTLQVAVELSADTVEDAHARLAAVQEALQRRVAAMRRLGSRYECLWVDAGPVSEV